MNEGALATADLPSFPRIEDLLRLQGRLLHVARLATIGEMSDGIAHELNQPLCAVVNYAQACRRLLGMQEPDMAEILGSLQEITSQALRAGEIIRRLRSLARPQEPSRVLTDINLLLTQLADFIQSDAEYHEVRSRLELGPGLPQVWANPAEIQQLVLNLVRNAIEAQEEVAPTLRDIVIRTSCTDDGDVEVCVSDQGPGVSASIAPRLFVPFCTTKAAGTGLGLSMSRTIARAHHGALDYRPNEPRGATFTLRAARCGDRHSVTTYRGADTCVLAEVDAAARLSAMKAGLPRISIVDGGGTERLPAPGPDAKLLSRRTDDWSKMVATLSSELVRSALDASPDAMVLVDSGGQILFVNQQFSALFGYEREAARGRPIEHLIPERYRAHHARYRQHFAAENRVRPMGAGLDLYGLRKDGSEFPVEISLSPLRQDGATLVAATIRDVTDRRRVQHEIVLAREAADRANQAKSRFLATASHDLRQPLQSLALLNGTLRRLVDDPDAIEALGYQDQAIEAMSRLLNALLDISKLESGAVKPERADFPVKQLFDEIEHEFMSVAASKGLRLEVARSAECIHSDPSLVEQILRNLVSNAVKYTRAGSVTLSAQRNPDCLRIEVVDTGIGIPPDQLQYIYDEFYQVGVPTNSSRDGYGLGLSIVQRLVSLLGLKLEVRSEVGKGSAFCIELPPGEAGAVDSPGRASPALAARQVTAPQVLLVEDDPAVRDATRMLLKVEGYRVLTAAGLAEARSLALENPRIELLVTDYHLSDTETGTEVIAALRECLGRPLKAVLMTGDTSSAMKDVQRDEGVRLASKPIHAEELLTLLKQLLTA